MYFTGQKHIMRPLQLMLPRIYEEHLPITLLFRGPSGYGKTKLALTICNYLTGGDFSYCLGSNFTFNTNKWVHFIDEVHLLNPPEVIYPRIDENRYVIILATNDAALLEEALVNRTTEFIFSNYTLEELRYIANGFLANRLDQPLVDYLIECSASNPRILKNLCTRLNLISKTHTRVWNLDIQEFRNLVRDLFGIEDGLDVASRRYIEALRTLGGRASLETVSTFLHIDKNTLRYFVEPILLHKNLIQISSKGRILV